MEREGGEAAPERSRRARLAAPLRVARSRLSAGRGRAALVVAGVAVATAAGVGLTAGSLLAQDLAVRRAATTDVGGLLRVDAAILPAGVDYDGADAAARRGLEAIAPSDVSAAIALRDVRIGRSLVRLGAVEDLAGTVRLREGRLPRSCTPQRCEVLQIGGTDLTAAEAPGVRLVRTGQADLRTPLALGPAFASGRVKAGRDAPALLLAGGGIRDLAQLPALELIYRTYSWVARLDPSTLHAWDVGPLLAREARVQNDLRLFGNAFTLRGPDRVLIPARRDAETAGRRALLVGGGASVLLLGFVLVAGGGLGRGLRAEWGRLDVRGARRWQLWTLAFAEAGVITLAGVVLGALLGALAAAAVAQRADADGGAILGRLLGSPAALALLLAAWLIATCLLVAMARYRGDSGRRGVTPLDALAVGSLLAIGLTAARGAADAGAVAAGRGTGLVLLALPMLAALVAGALVARALPPLLRVAERRTPRDRVTARLALLGLSRGGLRPSAGAAFATVAIGLAVFAAAYAATLERGARDQAAARVPLDVTLRAGPSLERPLARAAAPAYEALAPGVEAHAVVRRAVTAPGSGSEPVGAALIGVEPDAVAGLRRWRSSYADEGPRELASRIAVPAPSAPAGVELPAGASTVAVRASGTGSRVVLTLTVRAPDGSFERIRLGDVPEAPGTLSAAVPPALRGGRVVGLRAALTEGEQRSFTHRAAEDGNTPVPAGAIEIGPLLAGGKELTGWDGWVARAGGTREGSATGARVRFRFPEGETALLRPALPTDDEPLPAIVSPALARAAGSGGVVPLEVANRSIPVRVAGVARRFPSAGAQFAIVDERALSALLDADAPGSGTPDELWLAAPASSLDALERGLDGQAFAGLERTSRRTLTDEQLSDPLARAILWALAVTALLALLLALVAVALVAAGDLADERGELFDLEAQGADPADLRAQLRMRGALLVGVGIVGGIALGLALSALVVDLVQVAARVETPDPPLVGEVPWLAIAAGAVAFAVLAAAAVELVVRRGFAEDVPRHGSGELA